MSDDRSLSILVHGPAKAGKTHFAETAPGPRLFLDAEGGTRFTPTRKVKWDPMSEAPPAFDGSWDTCVVYVRDYHTISSVYQWLAAGQHPFKSVIMDSLSEVQQRCIDALAGSGRMDQQLWGDLLRNMSDLVRKMRDLTIHPTNPLEAIVLVAMTRTSNDGRHQPYVQGQLSTTLPYYLDVTGYFYTEVDPNTGELVRKLLVSPHPQFEAGDRTGRLDAVEISPHLEQMLNKIFGPRAEEATTKAKSNATGQKETTS